MSDGTHSTAFGRGLGVAGVSGSDPWAFGFGFPKRLAATKKGLYGRKAILCAFAFFGFSRQVFQSLEPTCHGLEPQDRQKDPFPAFAKISHLFHPGLEAGAE